MMCLLQFRIAFVQYSDPFSHSYECHIQPQSFQLTNMRCCGFLSFHQKVSHIHTLLLNATLFGDFSIRWHVYHVVIFYIQKALLSPNLFDKFFGEWNSFAHHVVGILPYHDYILSHLESFVKHFFCIESNFFDVNKMMLLVLSEPCAYGNTYFFICQCPFTKNFVINKRMFLRINILLDYEIVLFYIKITNRLIFNMARSKKHFKVVIFLQELHLPIFYQPKLYCQLSIFILVLHKDLTMFLRRVVQ